MEIFIDHHADDGQCSMPVVPSHTTGPYQQSVRKLLRDVMNECIHYIILDKQKLTGVGFYPDFSETYKQVVQNRDIRRPLITFSNHQSGANLFGTPWGCLSLSAIMVSIFFFRSSLLIYCRSNLVDISFDQVAQVLSNMVLPTHGSLWIKFYYKYPTACK